MDKRSLSGGVLAMVVSLCVSGAAWAQDAPANGATDDLNTRIHRQLQRIERGVKIGAINADQANRLKASVLSPMDRIPATIALRPVLFIDRSF